MVPENEDGKKEDNDSYEYDGNYRASRGDRLEYFPEGSLLFIVFPCHGLKPVRF
jgi:hypothetical protein